MYCCAIAESDHSESCMIDPLGVVKKVIRVGLPINVNTP
jgi:hypothetical protein